MNNIRRAAATALLETRRVIALTAAVLAVGGLSACGDHDSDNARTGHHTTGPEPTYSSAQQVAKAIKCTNYNGDFAVPGASDSGSCTYDGSAVIVAWFASPKATKSFHDLNATHASSVTFLNGANWSIQCSDAAACTSAHKVLGGMLG